SAAAQQVGVAHPVANGTDSRPKGDDPGVGAAVEEVDLEEAESLVSEPPEGVPKVSLDVGMRAVEHLHRTEGNLTRVDDSLSGRGIEHEPFVGGPRGQLRRGADQEGSRPDA